MPEAQPIDHAAELDKLAAIIARHPDHEMTFGPEHARGFAAAAALIRRQAEVLKELEWRDPRLRAEGPFDRDRLFREAKPEDFRVCPSCMRIKFDGHAPDCRLKAALDGR